MKFPPPVLSALFAAAALVPADAGAWSLFSSERSRLWGEIEEAREKAAGERAEGRVMGEIEALSDVGRFLADMSHRFPDYKPDEVGALRLENADRMRELMTAVRSGEIAVPEPDAAWRGEDAAAVVNPADKGAPGPAEGPAFRFGIPDLVRVESAEADAPSADPPVSDPAPDSAAASDATMEEMSTEQRRIRSTIPNPFFNAAAASAEPPSPPAVPLPAPPAVPDAAVATVPLPPPPAVPDVAAAPLPAPPAVPDAAAAPLPAPPAVPDAAVAAAPLPAPPAVPDAAVAAVPLPPPPAVPDAAAAAAPLPAPPAVPDAAVAAAPAEPPAPPVVSDAAVAAAPAEPPAPPAVPEIADDDPAIQLRAIAEMIRTARAADAVILLEDIVRGPAAGSTVEARVLLARALLECGNYPRAVEELNALPESAASDPAVRTLRAAAFLAVGRPQEALLQLDLLLEEHPDWSDAYVDCAYVMFLIDPRGNRDEAVELYRNGLSRGARRDPRLERELGVRVER